MPSHNFHNCWRNSSSLIELLQVEQLAIQSFGNKIVTPDALRNGKESVQSNLNNLPTADNFKGKVFFLLWHMGEVRELYQKDTNGLEGRAFFTTYYYEERFDRTETIFRLNNSNEII